MTGLQVCTGCFQAKSAANILPLSQFSKKNLLVVVCQGRVRLPFQVRTFSAVHPEGQKMDGKWPDGERAWLWTEQIVAILSLLTKVVKNGRYLCIVNEEIQAHCKL